MTNQALDQDDERDQDRDQDPKRKPEQEQVRRIWSEVLGVECEPATTFFEAGGNSLAAFRILARVETEFGVQLEVYELFEDPSTAEFAALIATAGQTR
ncbi:acyl carrier protein [Kribbella ginsengisoli]|uniref:Carrier domain-containing protein n=1 Tax=Kribbella ginsengisoli TaxID=363865 RepID=A0ABP6YCE4_9ACTN